jgi:hypothetical protein
MTRCIQFYKIIGGRIVFVIARRKKQFVGNVANEPVHFWACISMFVVLQYFCHENQGFDAAVKSMFIRGFIYNDTLELLPKHCLIFDSIGGTKLFCFVLYCTSHSILSIQEKPNFYCCNHKNLLCCSMGSLILSKTSFLTRNTAESSINGKREFESVGSHFRKWMIKV